MSGVVELTVVLVATFAAVWLPGAAVIKLAAMLKPHREDSSPTYPAGPAMDL
jgi:hypothetical protein